ncbi:uncharacterized protein F5147DRAFT_818498 [Suillus discolor]|uniref:C2H2-type domain-containing protein n=1 Tax=Suillus discolor TaxID=1912936 RepID=A0A9P7EX98_9AGAM|nr:uncharacterized protein F5147DRAFT_818498 [Suillus discolor]KAG2096351.1 hypothetical protein F5147DRAFT_818498 [Suillus discolor]
MDNLRTHRRKRHERTIISSTLQNPLSSWPGQAPDQHSTRLVLESCLQRLDRLDSLERRVHEEIQQIRSVLTNLLGNYQSDVTMENSGGRGITVDSQAEISSLNPIAPFGPSHDRYFVPQIAPHGTSFGVTGSLSEGTSPPQALLPHGARTSADYGPIVQHPLTQPRYSMYPEARSSFCDPHVMASPLEDLSLRGALDSVYEPESVPIQVKDKIKCTWYGCSALVKKDNLRRHVKEVHEGKIKAVCAGCGKEFKRPYQMDEHIVRTRCRSVPLGPVALTLHCCLKIEQILPEDACTVCPRAKTRRYYLMVYTCSGDLCGADTVSDAALSRDAEMCTGRNRCCRGSGLQDQFPAFEDREKFLHIKLDPKARKNIQVQVHLKERGSVGNSRNNQHISRLGETPRVICGSTLCAVYEEGNAKDVSTEKKISTDNNSLTKLETDLVNTSWRTTEFIKVSNHHIMIDETMLGDAVAIPFAIWTWRVLRLYVW